MSVVGLLVIKPMSQMGQKWKCPHFQAMSALPHKADIKRCGGDVRFVPQTDSCTAAKLFDALVGAGQ